jgi:hypothetical protein
MSENKHHHHPQEGPNPPKDPDNYVPYWKRAHKDWRFWVGVFCISAALVVYITSVDLSLVPHRPDQPSSRTP